MSHLTIQPNTYVTIDYELKDEDGELLDASQSPDGEPMRYVHGYGMLVPGLESALGGLAAGEEREIVVPAEAGYGEYDDDLVLEIARSDLPDPTAVEAGDEFIAESPDGEQLAVTVQAVNGDGVLVDANHPLAGMTLRYSVKVREVRPATPEEIEQAAADLDDAHEHVHGPDCAHTHEPLSISGRSAN